MKELGRTLFRQVRSSEKGQFLSPNLGRARVRRKNWAQPWFGRFEVLRKASSFSELRTVAGSEFGESTGWNLCSAGSKFGARIGPNAGLAGSEFGERPVSFSEL